MSWFFSSIPGLLDLFAVAAAPISALPELLLPQRLSGLNEGEAPELVRPMIDARLTALDEVQYERVLIQGLASETPYVREACVERLGSLRSGLAIVAISRLLHDSDPYVRTAVIHILSALAPGQPPEVIDELQLQLNKPVLMDDLQPETRARYQTLVSIRKKSVGEL